MRWFQRTPTPTPLTSLDGFRLGQIVQHKIDGVRAVIVGFDTDALGPIAVGAFSSKPGDQADFYLAEIEAASGPVPLRVDASPAAAGSPTPDQQDGPIRAEGSSSSSSGSDTDAVERGTSPPPSPPGGDV
jgi:hypothetical protein